MYFRDVITLNTVTQTTGTRGELIETPTTKTVMAEKLGVKRSEFYQANTAGYKPEVTFRIREIEYNNEPTLTYGLVTYDIYRTYPVENECIELVCQRGVR